ncbi:sulfotransferase [Phaeovulum sp.]|uniref:sulfotransferase n=1 Tax=Phaeovulum sp. TaxID=2934796 RepID=UPI0039E4CB34
MPPTKPDPVHALFAQGQKHQSDRRFDDALACYEQILKINPDIAEVHFHIGRICAVTDRFSRALAHLSRAAALKPAEPAIWQAWAEAAALAADPQADAALLGAVKSAPIAPALRIAVQDRFARPHGRPPAPISAAKRPALDRILKHLKAGKPAEAQRLAAAEAARHPQEPAFANALGMAQRDLGAKEAAIASFRRAVALQRGYAEAQNNLGTTLRDLGRTADAARAFRAAVIAAPNWPAALINLADMLNRLGAQTHALPYAQKAATLDPRSAAAPLLLGEIHFRLSQYAEAAEAFSRALVADPAGLQPRLSLAQAHTRLGHVSQAMDEYDRVLNRAPDHANALAGKAGLLQSLGQFDDAEALFRRSFGADPTNGENYRLFIASHRTRADDPLLEQMVTRFNAKGLPDTDRMNFGFAIAKALEDTRQYDRVFEYLNIANGLMRKAWPYDISHRLNEVRALQEAYAGFDFATAQPEGACDYAPIFVTGMPRSGTTLVERIIAAHSKVEAAGEAGVAAGAALRLISAADGRFAPVSSLPAEAIAAVGREYAEKLGARFPDAARVTDKSILTYMHIGLIKLALPKARIIVVRRDPRDTLLSIYKNKFAEGTHLYAYDLGDLAQYYRSFVEMVGFWRRRVPDWIYEVDYESLVANPETESRNLIAAAGLEWEDQCLESHKNVRKVDTLSVYQARQPISAGSVQSWKRYEKELGMMMDALGDILTEAKDGIE